MKKYEYKVVTIGYNDCLDLRELGNEGWEMCGVLPREEIIVYYFKRVKE